MVEDKGYETLHAAVLPLVEVICTLVSHLVLYMYSAAHRFILFVEASKQGLRCILYFFFADQVIGKQLELGGDCNDF